MITDAVRTLPAIPLFMALAAFVPDEWSAEARDGYENSRSKRPVGGNGGLLGGESDALVAAPGDAPEDRLAAGRHPSRHQAEPGGKVARRRPSL
jgi:hypothetical protein